MITLLYFDYCVWEFDFIINDILYNIDINIEYFNKENFELLLNRSDIHNSILVVSRFLELSTIIKVAQHIKPTVIIYLSDESGVYPERVILEKYTKLLLRNYNHKYNYGYNNYHMLLGYSKLFLNGKHSFDIQQNKMKDRTINCSFIGVTKSDREHMKHVFEDNMKNTNIHFVTNTWNINKLEYSPQDCFNVYNNSIFVISGRGNVSLNCFRIYETIVAGAIPVIVGTKDEIERTFKYNNMPPFIYDESWEKVVITCNELLNNIDELQIIQDNLLSWWKNEIQYINQLIKLFLDKPQC